MDETQYEPPVPGQPASKELRKLARKRILERRGLQAHLLAYGTVNAFLIAIWAISGFGFFWPMFPLMGWGIGLAFHVWDYLTPGATEEQIQAEIRRMVGE